MRFGGGEGSRGWGRAWVGGESPLALAKESLQRWSGLSRRKRGGHLTDRTRIKMTRRRLTSEAALCSVGKPPSLRFSEILDAYSREQAYCVLLQGAAFQPATIWARPEDSGPISRIKGWPPGSRVT